MDTSECAQLELNAQLNEAKQKIHELQEELDTAKLQNTDLRSKNTDVRRRRTADRKQWTAGQQRGIQYQREICTLKTQLSCREHEQRCGGSPYLYTSGHSTPTTLHVEGNDQDIKLIQQENKKLRSRQSLLEDTMKENQALHEDRVQKAKQIGDLLNELECTIDIDPEKDHQTDELEQKVKKLKELATSHRNTLARVQETSKRRAMQISGLKVDTQRKATEIALLTKKVEQQDIELGEYRTESEQHRCRKPKLAAFLDSIDFTKDDLDDEEPQTKKSVPPAVSLALNAASGSPNTSAQVVVKPQSPAQS